MKYVVSAFARTLFILIALSFFAAPLHADPVVTFMAGGDNPMTLQTVNVPFGEFFIDANGRLKLTIINNTDLTILDFHIEITPLPTMFVQGSGLPFFGDVISTTGRIDFEVGTLGVGIQPGQTFMIIFEGLEVGTTITVTATTTAAPIPEPASLLLLGTGVAGVAIKARKKLKRRKSEHERKQLTFNDAA
jgi:PEP-CTERM motif